ncbi:hypothetical protein DFJ73DRAFT_852925 [Zopfochytrium polystomum]|nr:hypothetical protein DFJ73DRAFT_852925 [Zopfochytrium polystomum]
MKRAPPTPTPATQPDRPHFPAAPTPTAPMLTQQQQRLPPPPLPPPPPPPPSATVQPPFDAIVHECVLVCARRLGLAVPASSSDKAGGLSLDDFVAFVDELEPVLRKFNRLRDLTDSNVVSGFKKRRLDIASELVEGSFDSGVNKRIDDYISSQRTHIDNSNRQEFTVQTGAGGGAARTSAAAVNRNVQMKLDHVENEDPLARTTNRPGSTTSKTRSSAELRIAGLEEHLLVRSSPDLSLNERLCALESRLLDLERNYPAWSAVHFNHFLKDAKHPDGFNSVWTSFARSEGSGLVTQKQYVEGVRGKAGPSAQPVDPANSNEVKFTLIILIACSIYDFLLHH